jgi:hypothetical protein
MKVKKDLRACPVQKSPCSSCPFAGKYPVQLSLVSMAKYIENLCGKGQHFCHSTNNKTICRGGRDIQLRWLCSIGMLQEATDEAFDCAINEAVEII